MNFIHEAESYEEWYIVLECLAAQCCMQVEQHRCIIILNYELLVVSMSWDA